MLQVYIVRMYSAFSIFQFSLFHTKIDQSSARVVETTLYLGYSSHRFT